MRVLITTDPIGGVWPFAQELAWGLLGKGFGVALAVLGGVPSAAQQAQCARLASIYGKRFRSYLLSAQLEWMPDNEGAYRSAEESLLRICNEFGADVLQVNQFCFGALPLQIPKVVTAHSDVLSWADHCRGGKLEDSEWLCRYERLVTDGLKGADGVIAPTAWMLGALAQNFALPRRTHVIANGRTILQEPCSEHRLQAITAGRLWDEAKDVGMLIGISSPFPILAAGDCKDERAERTSRWGGITWLGQLCEEELLACFRESAVYICTSRYEPFGLAPLEAALCGCAVVSRDIASLREVWAEGAVYFRDRESLSAVLHQLYENPDRLKAAQTSALRRARYFTAERMVNAYSSLFAEMHQEAEARAYVA
jgi:glycogen synthase